MSGFEKKFVAEVRRLARENPDYVYAVPREWSEYDQRFVEMPSCQYVETDEETGALCGSCIIGQALIACGFSEQELAADGINTKGFASLSDELTLPIRPKVRDWAATVQRRQDNKATWSAAVRHADEWYPIDL